MKILYLFEYQKYKNYCDNFLHNVFNIIKILKIIYIYIYIYIIIYFMSFNMIALNEL